MKWIATNSYAISCKNVFAKKGFLSLSLSLSLCFPLTLSLAVSINRLSPSQQKRNLTIRKTLLQSSPQLPISSFSFGLFVFCLFCIQQFISIIRERERVAIVFCYNSLHRQCYHFHKSYKLTVLLSTCKFAPNAYYMTCAMFQGENVSYFSCFFVQKSECETT